MKATLCLLLGLLGLVKPQTMDQLISAAAETSRSMDLLHDDHTILVELDMLFTKKDWDEIQKLNSTGKIKKRNALRETRKRWTDNIVPYTISSDFSKYDKDQVQAAFDDWQQYTCLKFQPATDSHSNRIVLQNGGGCSSYVGMNRGSQVVTLAPGCRRKGVIIHELGHAIGFHHEQTRPDRDQHVTIEQDNIQPHTLFNFQKYSQYVINTYSVPYDYTSVMHYGQYAFTRNGKPTILTKDSSKQHLIGNRYGHSFWDIKLANLMYGCNRHCTSKLSCPGEGFVGKDCKCWCPGSPVKPCNGTGGGEGSGEGGGEGGSGGGEGRRGGKKECGDNHNNCPSWAARGDCSKNPSYMEENCKLSCKKCEGDNGEGGEGGATGKNTTCADVKSYCGTLKEKGYCTNKNHDTFMVTYCRNTCNMCDRKPPACVDGNRYCSAWARVGYCRSWRYASYMKTYCKKSCRICTANPAAPNEFEPVVVSFSGRRTRCRDKSVFCILWAKMGKCKKNRSSMALHCTKSCGYCRRG